MSVLSSHFIGEITEQQVDNSISLDIDDKELVEELKEEVMEAELEEIEELFALAKQNH